MCGTLDRYLVHSERQLRVGGGGGGLVCGWVAAARVAAFVALVCGFGSRWFVVRVCVAVACARRAGSAAVAESASRAPLGQRADIAGGWVGTELAIVQDVVLESLFASDGTCRIKSPRSVMLPAPFQKGKSYSHMDDPHANGSFSSENPKTDLRAPR